MLRILEIAWLCIAIGTLCISCWQFFTDDESSALFMLFGTGIASIMYIVRRKQRIKMDEHRHKEEDTARYH